MHSPLYRECAVEQRAHKLTTGVNPDFQPTARGNGCYSAELEYVVDAQGRPDANTARVVRTNTSALAEAAIKVLPRFRFEPAKREGVAVAQIVLEKFEMITKTMVVPAGTRPNPGRAGPGC